MGQNSKKSGTRCFIAIPVPVDLARLYADLGRGAGCGRPVPEENLHLTLAFLDDQPRDLLSDLAAELSEVRHSGFSVGISGVGQFGSTLHLTISPEPALLGLQQKVLRCTRLCGMNLSRRRFRPHITIVRRMNASLNRDFSPKIVLDTQLNVMQFDLVASTLHPDGARYETLAVFPLDPASADGQPW
ncbi:MAG: RNA 2',3'-cyclic phosphodiesterase [Ruegeria sp.]